jgi:acyl-CoA hydrolase
VRHTNSAYVTYVALDENGRPRSVPPLDLDTPTAERRAREAENRRRMREAIIKAEGY